MEENVKMENGTQAAEGQKTEPTKAEEPKKEETKTEQKTEPKKENWFKRHWKGLVAGAAGTGAAAASVIVAWRKGKQAGVNQAADYYSQQHEVSPLDPNV